MATLALPSLTKPITLTSRTKHASLQISTTVCAGRWVATASDGSARVPDGEQPHPRNFGTFTRKLGVYAQKEGILSMRDAVRSSTSLPAEILGLKDRGLLRAGYAADVVVFDPKTVVDRATYDHPYRYSDGVRYVFVNGVAAIADGTPTGALGGRALRKAK